MASLGMTVSYCMLTLAVIVENPHRLGFSMDSGHYTKSINHYFLHKPVLFCTELKQRTFARASCV